MKTNFTSTNKSLLNILFIFLVISSLSSSGQTKYVVQVTNNKYTPKDLSIQVGDTVEWQNTEGYHNVNASQSIYPSNPESFSNTLGYGWTFNHVFSASGKYDYRCDAHYQLGMVGTVTVSGATASKFTVTNNFSKVFPNPAHEKFFIETGEFSSSDVQVRIFDLTGKLKFSKIYPTSEKIEVNIQQLNEGIYLVELSNNSKRQMLKLMKE